MIAGSVFPNIGLLVPKMMGISVKKVVLSNRTIETIWLLFLHPSKYPAILIPSNNLKARAGSVLVSVPPNQVR